MAVRYPPENNVPPVGKRTTRRPPPRIVKYEEPDEGFFRRWMRRIFRPWVVIALVVITTVIIAVFGYYWHVFSERIDARLRGEVFTRSAGIYAAPKQMRVGENVSADELIERLKRTGYVEKAQQADSARGRYNVSGAMIEIEPSADAAIDGQRTFQRLRVQFARGGKGIAAITNMDGNTRLDKASLEPELISSVTGRERTKRKVIGFNDLPPALVSALTVTEDRDFFNHYGVNLRGIARAFVRRYDADPNSPIARQGGSSITQQLVKNLLLSPERTWSRKVAEAYMSLILETRLSKQQILALYANEVYLGQQAGFSINGFGEAADAYFDKDVTKITLPEAAFLAGIIRSPNRYNPYRDLDTATARRNQVLVSMSETGAVSPLESAQAQATPLKVASVKGRIDSSDAPYFADYVQTQLADIVAGQGAADHLRIYTTVDMDLQRAAYAALTKQLAALDKIYQKKIAPGTLQAALVAMDAHTGEIVAMVGGRDYSKSQLNRAVDAMRQPGSVFKPFVYATALNTAYESAARTITPATIYQDAPKTFNFGNQEYSPGNYGDVYSNGPVTLRDALVHSLNVVTVDVAQEVTIGRVMNLAAKAGLPKPKDTYLSRALGTSEATPLEVASAYTSFAANGTRATPIAINRVATGSGQTVIAPTAQHNEVMRPDVAYVMTSILKDVVNRGTAAKVRARGFKANVAGKTGTSRDGWFAGYTPNLVCVVYVGFDDGSQLGLTGADSALPIWADFMTAALNAHPEWGGDWQLPATLQQAVIDTRTGQLASADNPNKRTELFINSTAPTVASTAPEDETQAAAPEDSAPPPAKDDNGSYDYEPAPLLTQDAPPPPPSSSSTRNRHAPRLEGHGVTQSDGSTRLEGTITLDIDPTTGLIAVPSCPVIRSKTFVIGTEPRQYCSPQYHTGRSVSTTTRPRLVSP
jgi:penicillin-binding protein 1B